LLERNFGVLAMLTDFLALSQILTGVEALDAELGRGYLERLTSGPFDPSIRRILERFREMKGDVDIVHRVKEEILAEDDLRPAVCQIILLWYTSAMQDTPDTPPVLRYGTQEEYFSGLAWQIMGAHVPGLSGGYFGHWRYRPENAPKGQL
jgi:Membrane bound FAD containing D-sorbitol dehydrogenase